MRRSWVIAAVVVVAALAIGLTQLQGTGVSGGGNAPSLATAQKRLVGSPPALGAVHRLADALLPADQFAARITALHGYPIVVNVWGSWCPPCRAEFPVFQRVSTAVGKQVAFLGVATQDAKADSAKFLHGHPVTYPSYTDFDGKIRASFGLAGTPSTVFYDRNGKQAFLHQGPYRSDAALRADIKRYVGA